MRTISLSEFPISVLELHTWSWWRRFWKRPPALVRRRCEAWRELLGLREAAGKNVRLNTPKSKIFEDSRRRWDFLDDLDRGNFTLRGRFPVSAWGAKEAFQSPHGSLVQMTMVPHFECDASDIEGISSSKSADKPHESVDVFGAYYIDEQNRYARKGKPPLRLDDASLKELCSHDQIRLLHGSASDTFSVRAWDGRLFLDNSGGSHHLAGAVHVAKRIGARIPLASKRTLATLAGGLAVAVLGATMWSLQPRKRGANEQTELYNVDRVSRSEGLDKLPTDYSKLPPQIPELGPPLPGDLGPAIVKSQQPVVPTYTPPGQDPAAAGRDAQRKEAEAAAGSSVFFRSGGQRAAATPTQVVTASLTSGLSGFDPMGAGPASTAAQPADPTAVQNRQDQKEAFLKAGSTETRNSGNLRMPASAYQVMAGTVIAGALVTGIKSDLPGDVIATVTEPIYDTATGKFMLIPQGSRILGRYNSQVSYGQSRVQVVWNRIILPDTSSLTLDNLAGTDPAGYAGLEDGVDWHWDRIFAGAALTTLLGIGAELAAPESRQNGDRVVIAGRDSLQDSVNQVGQEMTRRNLNIQPTLTERPGLPVRIIVNRDLVLRPYQPLFFNRGTSR